MNKLSNFLRLSFWLLLLFSNCSNTMGNSKSAMEKGSAKCIHISAEGTLSTDLSEALADLKNSLIKMTKLSVNTGQPACGYQITLKEDPSLLGKHDEQSFRIVSGEERVLIEGASTKAVEFGIYYLLEKMGCHWYFPGEIWTEIPNVSNLSFPKLNSIETPYFKQRVMLFNQGNGQNPVVKKDFKDWWRRNRLGGVRGLVGHSYKFVLPKEKFFSTNPELFSLIDGKRKAWGQLCISNEEVQERAVKWAFREIEKNPHKTLISVSPNDNARWCECNGCKAIGSDTDQAMFLANHVARKIKPKYPDKFVGVNAYASTAVPGRLSADDNVIVYIATRYSPFSFYKLLPEWSKKAKHIGVRDYFSIIQQAKDLPISRFRHLEKLLSSSLGSEVRYYHLEGGNQWASEGLNQYIVTKSLWNPTKTISAYEDDFFKTCWAGVSEEMEAYYAEFSQVSTFSNQNILEMAKLLDKADQKNNNPVVGARINAFKKYIVWLDKFYSYGEIKDPDTQMKAIEDCLIYTWRLRNEHLIHSHAQFQTAHQIYPPLRKKKDKEYYAGLKKRAVALGPVSDREVAPLFEKIVRNSKDVTKVKNLWQKAYLLNGSPSSLAASTKGMNNQKNVRPQQRYRQTNSFIVNTAVSNTIDVSVLQKKGNDVRYVFKDIKTDEVLEQGIVALGKPRQLSVPQGHGQFVLLTIFGPKMVYFLPNDNLLWDLEDGKGSYMNKESDYLYFYVPPNTEAFSIAFTSPSRDIPKLEIFNAEEKLVNSFKERNTYGREYVINVPPGSANSIWSFKFSENLLLYKISLKGVPPYVSSNPRNLFR